MTEKELKKMKRPALLEILVSQSKEIDRLRAELEKKEKELQDRRIIIEKSGSLAEASLEIFHVLESAQKAADLYLENAKRAALEYQAAAGSESEEELQKAKTASGIRHSADDRIGEDRA